MKNRFVLVAGVMIAWFGFVSVVDAHITLEQRSATVGNYHKLVFRVPHGCQGAATTKISITIPEGVIAVKPQPKPGWKLEKIRGDYKRSYTLHGNTLTAGVRLVTWSEGRLPDDEFDEFAFSAFFAPGLEPNSMLSFPVLQGCGQREVRWDQIPTARQSSHEIDVPAPTLKLLSADAPGME